MKEEIKKIIEDLFEKANLQISIEDIKEKEERFFIEIKTEEPEVLNYEKEKVIFDFQHLLRIIVKRKFGMDIFIDLDINGYKEKKKERLKEVAIFVANEVSLIKKEKELPPMSSYERRIIHLELSERKDIKTESIGEGIERRIVVRPCP